MTPPPCSPGCEPKRAPNGALYALGFAATLVAVDVVRRRKNRAEFLENAALLAVTGAFFDWARGR